MDRSRARAIPDEFTGFAEQALLNMALRGFTIRNERGQDITTSMLSQAARINEDYQKALLRARGMAAKKAAPDKKITPHPTAGKPSDIKPRLQPGGELTELAKAAESMPRPDMTAQLQRAIDEAAAKPPRKRAVTKKGSK